MDDDQEPEWDVEHVGPIEDLRRRTEHILL